MKRRSVKRLRVRRLLLLSLMACAVIAPAAGARTFETRDEAFARLFPQDVVDRRTAFLTEQQMQQVQKNARARLQQARITYYVISRQDSVVGRAYLDTHPVRSMQETLLILLTSTGQLVTVDVLAFHEPEDYLPRRAWYKRLPLLKEPTAAGAGDDVDAVSGATLTVQATCEALRRVTNLDAILFPRKEPVSP